MSEEHARVQHHVEDAPAHSKGARSWITAPAQLQEMVSLITCFVADTALAG